MTKNDPQKNAAKTVVTKLQSKGYIAYWAGGCVRDLLLGLEPKDYDIATSALPEEVETLFDKTHDLGKAFGVIQVMIDQIGLEVATFRTDGGYQDHRHPDHVTFTGPKEDALRRDFTINGIFWDPSTEELHDYIGGKKDLNAHIIRAIGNPSDRFEEDALRMLRAVRFSSVLNFTLDQATADAIRKKAPSIHSVSPERIRQELVRLLTESKQAGAALEQLHATGLLAEILPEILPMIGQEQPPQFHPEGDVFVHTTGMLNMMNNPSLQLAFSVLLHDVGKPATATENIEPDGSTRIRFNGHESVGARMAEKILTRLKFSNNDREAIVHAVATHMTFANVPQMKKSTLRKLVGNPHIDLDLDLHRLDCLGSHGLLNHYEQVIAFREELGKEPALPPALINGHLLMARGLVEGPKIGKWKAACYDMQLTHPEWTQEQLIKWLEKTSAL